MANLSNRIEAASGPDRALDGEIDRTVNARPKDGDYDAHEGAFWRVGDHSGLLVRANGFARDAFSALNYTASIDAALTLVPTQPYPGIRLGRWWWMLETWPYEAKAHIAYENGDAGVPEFEATAATPALALCAAALRAKESSDGE